MSETGDKMIQSLQEFSEALEGKRKTIIGVTELAALREELARLRDERAVHVGEIEHLRAENETLTGKAIKYDLDQIGIDQRTANDIELVELRAEKERLNRAIASFGNGNEFDWNVLAKIDQLEQENERLRALLREVYDQCGNHRPAEKRHALMPRTRDAIRDVIYPLSATSGESEGK